jgi:hypothetical protein
MWRAIVLRLCEQYWPRSDFPHWLNCREHPAHHFIAGCLIWQPRFVFAEWILPSQLPVSFLPYDPRDMSEQGHPAAMEWKTRYETLAQTVRETIERNGAFLAKDMTDISDAIDRAAIEPYQSEAHGRQYPVLLVYPGMSAEELRKSASAVIETIRERFDIKKRVRQLASEDIPKAEIARRLGVARKSVQEWVEAEVSRPGCDFSAEESQRPTG